MSRLPPGPSSRVPFRLFARFRADPLAFIEQMRGYGSVSHMRLAGLHVYLLCEDELIKEVLLDQQGRFEKGRALNRAKAILGSGLLTSEPPLHTRQKRLVMPAFHRQRIPLYAAEMLACCRRSMQAWQDGQALDLWREMMQLTQAIAASTLFGARVEGEAAELCSAINGLMEDFEVVSLPGGDLLRWLPLPSSLRYHRARRRLNALVHGIIQARRAAQGAGDDLLSMLLKAQDEDGGTMSDLQVRDEVMTLFLAGHETTSNALTWAWYLLARHPEAAAAMQRELDQVLAGAEPAAEHVPRLAYTTQVFAEALRLYPPAWTVSRRALKATRLGPWEVPAGSILLISQWLMHRDPRYWPEPEAFRPERHSEAAKAGRPAFAYFPFSAGPRGCVGEGFAWMEGVLILASLAQKWRFELASELPVKPQPLITLRPWGGLPVRAFRR